MGIVAQAIQATKVSPLVAFLIVGVITPAVGILWFMFNSIDNERLATLKKLEILYEQQTRLAIIDFEKHWSNTLTDAEEKKLTTNAEAFSRLIAIPSVISALVFDNEGNITYPSSGASNVIPKKNQNWLEAQHAEHKEKNYHLALDYYRDISKNTQGQEKNLADIATARILKRLKDTSSSIDALLSVFKSAEPNLKGTRDLRLDAGLRALELTTSINETTRQGKIVDELMHRLNNYAAPLHDSQRFFIMQNLKKLSEQHSISITLPNYQAEWIARNLNTQANKAKLLNNWRRGDLIPITSESSKFVLIAERIELERYLKTFFKGQDDHDIDYSLTKLPSSEANNRLNIIYKQELGSPFNGYTLTLSSPSGSKTKHSTNTTFYSYLATGALVLLILIVSSSFVAYRMRKQERLNQLKSDIMATVSHELRTPLSSIRLLVDNLLEEDSTYPDKVHEYIKIISDENERLTRLVNNFLEFSQIDRDKYNFDLRHCNMHNAIKPAIQYVQHRFAREGVEFNPPSKAYQFDIWADPQKITIVIINLLENAFKYSSAPRIIQLDVTEELNSICISVTDTGVGISEKDQKKIFDQFYRVEQTLSRSTEGCGLGLYISSYIVKKHNGYLSVKSTFGEGSTFTIHLPKTSSA